MNKWVKLLLLVLSHYPPWNIDICHGLIDVKMPSDVNDLGRDWFRQWFASHCHQACPSRYEIIRTMFPSLLLKMLLLLMMQNAFQISDFNIMKLPLGSIELVDTNLMVLKEHMPLMMGSTLIQVMAFYPTAPTYSLKQYPLSKACIYLIAIFGVCMY